LILIEELKLLHGISHSSHDNLLMLTNFELDCVNDKIKNCYDDYIGGN